MFKKIKLVLNNHTDLKVLNWFEILKLDLKIFEPKKN